jgi:hypothetical protein
MLCQRAAAAQFDVIGMRADRQHRLSRHAPSILFAACVLKAA